jgi:SAM-dependent methyltransferase
MKKEEIKKIVREGYARVAQESGSCCGPLNSCTGATEVRRDISKRIGYTEDEIQMVPEGANLGLGCGNPVALASLREGETVLDLGSGAGFDCFLAASRVGPKGRVIGVDMTPAMIEKARQNADKGHYDNVEFRLGDIENLPVPDRSVDIIISNCVINLTVDKKKAFTEAFRVLRAGGRLMVSDIVLSKELPDFIRNSIEAYVGCVAGAMVREEYLEAIGAAGFQDVRIIEESSFPVDDMANDPTVQRIVESSKLSREQLREVASSVRSAKIYAFKPDAMA